jgi:hypothetical protein
LDRSRLFKKEKFMSENELKELIEKDYRERMRICARLGVTDPPTPGRHAIEYAELAQLGDHIEPAWTEKEKWEHATRQSLTQYQAPKFALEGKEKS